ncbi:MAG: sensor histidine kinase [Niabella sp.]
MDTKLSHALDSLNKIMNADATTIALRNNIIDSLNTRFTHIENIQKETFFFTRLFKYILPILALAILFTIILFFQNNKIRKQKKHLENLQKEQHHRVHNSLGVVSSLLNTYKDNITPENLANIDNSIIAISTVHRQLYKGNDLEHINFQPVAESIFQSLLSQRELSDTVTLTIDANVMIPQKTSTVLALIFNELFTNSLKYAFDKNSLKTISLSTIHEDGHILVIYRDNGKGYNTDFLKHKTTGFGRVLIEGLAHQLRAKIMFYNEEGACCMIKI